MFFFSFFTEYLQPWSLNTYSNIYYLQWNLIFCSCTKYQWISKHWDDQEFWVKWPKNEWVELFYLHDRASAWVNAFRHTTLSYFSTDDLRKLSPYQNKLRWSYGLTFIWTQQTYSTFAFTEFIISRKLIYPNLKMSGEIAKKGSKFQFNYVCENSST